MVNIRNSRYFNVPQLLSKRLFSVHANKKLKAGSQRDRTLFSYYHNGKYRISQNRIQLGKTCLSYKM